MHTHAYCINQYFFYLVIIFVLIVEALRPLYPRYALDEGLGVLEVVGQVPDNVLDVLELEQDLLLPPGQLLGVVLVPVLGHNPGDSLQGVVVVEYLGEDGLLDVGVDSLLADHDAAPQERGEPTCTRGENHNHLNIGLRLGLALADQSADIVSLTSSPRPGLGSLALPASAALRCPERP